uniref:Glycosyltransferase 2-like domain-containing protein n=1 Tax=Romanomermis culicivorax TaxID=13658 RepID=A0A915JDP9_ROMCU
MGKLRLQLKYFHKPLFGWKGSYVVTQLCAERRVSFDHGPDGSVAEDCFFSMVAQSRHPDMTFDFIEGEMYEKSPFSLWDFLQQRKRWLQGIFLVVHSRAIPWLQKPLIACMFYAWLTLPLAMLNLLLAPIYPLPCHPALDALVAYVGAVNSYMYAFGAYKSFGRRHKRRRPVCHLGLCLLGALLIAPLNGLVESVAVLWGIFGRKHQFYVVRKESVLFNV